MLEVGQGFSKAVTTRHYKRGTNHATKHGKLKYVAFYPDSENAKRGEDFIMFTNQPHRLIIANTLCPEQFTGKRIRGLKNNLIFVGFEVSSLIDSGRTNPTAKPVLGAVPRRNTLEVKFTPSGLCFPTQRVSKKNMSAYLQLMHKALNSMGYSYSLSKKSTQFEGEYHRFQRELNESLYLLFWDAMGLIVPQIRELFEKEFNKSCSVAGFKPRKVRNQNQRLVELKSYYLLAFFYPKKVKKLRAVNSGDERVKPSEDERIILIRQDLDSCIRSMIQGAPCIKIMPVELVYPIKRERKFK